MKNIVTCASLAALGVATLNAAYAPGMSSTQTTKPWSVAASFRGFYDDNYNTASKDAPKFGAAGPRDSFGFELSPAASLNLFRDQTTLGLSYRYDMRFYEDRPDHRADHSHEAGAKLSHAFSPRFTLDVEDNFVRSQEPSILNTGTIGILPIRPDSTSTRNDGKISLNAGWSDRFSTVLGYHNTYWDFDSRGPGSYSAILDRDEHLISIDGRYQVVPSTIAVLGYNFGIQDYTSNDLLDPTGVAPFTGNSRDNYSHYVYAGVDHTFNPQLNASLRAGAQYTEYVNLPVHQDTINPYVEAGVSWTFRPESALGLNVRHARGAAPIPTISAGTPVLDVETTLAQISLNHKITSKFNLTGLLGYQYSEYYAGPGNPFNNQTENYFFGNLALTYEINKFLAAEAGYNYDRLDADIFARSFTRNRVYLGIRASY